MQLNNFIERIIGLARDIGYADDNPVRFSKIMGPTVNQLPVTRAFVVSSETPPLYPGSATCIWINASDLTAKKSSNWYDQDSPQWESVASYDDLFIDRAVSSTPSGGDPDPNALPVTGGTMSGPLLLFRDPVASNEAATRSYVDNVVRLIAAGKLYIEHPVTTVVELRALDVSTVPDEQVIFVEETRRMYAYDLQGGGIDDGKDIITPASGIGRWLSTTPYLIDGGVM